LDILFFPSLTFIFKKNFVEKIKIKETAKKIKKIKKDKKDKKG